MGLFNDMLVVQKVCKASNLWIRAPEEDQKLYTLHGPLLLSPYVAEYVAIELDLNIYCE